MITVTIPDLTADTITPAAANAVADAILAASAPRPGQLVDVAGVRGRVLGFVPSAGAIRLGTPGGVVEAPACGWTPAGPALPRGCSECGRPADEAPCSCGRELAADRS